MKKTILAIFVMVVLIGLVVIVQARSEIPKAVQEPMWSVWMAINGLQERVAYLQERVAALEGCGCDGQDPGCDPAVETCSDPDDTCDASALLAEDCDGPDADLCTEGITQCVAGTLTCTDDTGDNVEECNGEDDDCDGLIDEGACEEACVLDTDCPAEPATCQDPSSCQGTRLDGVCDQGVCTTIEVPDDSACEGREADDCGYYPSIYCTGEEDQEPMCPDTCAEDAECDQGAHCEGTCEPDLDPGSYCEMDEQCAGGLFCVDEACCTSSCSGTCMTCGSGECTDLAYGEDPDEECDGIDCSGQYYGWVGDTCYRRANAPAMDVGCNGNGACQDAEDICPQQDAGEPDITCSEPETPDYSTCEGTTPGACLA